MKVLYIMQGIPGSGKSTVAANLVAGFDQVSETQGIVRSTDEYWYLNSDTYDYRPDEAGAAHRWNQRRVARDMMENTAVIVVDNTNIKREAALPYLTLAEMFEYEVRVIRVSCSLKEAKRRNNERPEDRRIPDDVIENMAQQLEKIV